MKAMAYTAAVLVLAGTACDDSDNMAPATSQRVVTRTEIVSDQPGAKVTDDTLVNAWGLAFNPMGVAWVTATESGVSKVYDANGNEKIPAVAIPNPSDAASPSAPTGQVYNGDANAFEGDAFAFVTEDGTISGWQQVMGETAVVRVDNSAGGAIYKGVTIVKDSTGAPRLFAADFHNGRVDVFDANYAQLTVSGGFNDPQLPADFAPFNVEALNGALLVTYALQDEDKEDDVKGAGNGYVDLFDLDGTLMTRLISGGELNAPWGVAMSSARFAAAPNRLLIGNFGDGMIHVYALSAAMPPTATHEGALLDTSGGNLMIDGLWALKFAPDAGGFSSSQLYYTAGPDDETHGVFGRIEAAAGTAPSTGGAPVGVPGGRGY